MNDTGDALYCLVYFLVLLLIYFSNSTKINKVKTDFSRRTEFHGVIIISSSYFWEV
jgi:hypothetical protein